jgi:hypothetical protein
MAALEAAIHAPRIGWMAGSSPAMTVEGAIKTTHFFTNMTKSLENPSAASNAPYCDGDVPLPRSSAG